MKRKLLNISVGMTALVFFSCEEVILLDLSSSAQRIVLEATLDADQGLFFSRLTKTANYYEQDDFVSIPGAIITISTSTGKNYQCLDSGNGSYTAKNIAVNGYDSVNVVVRLPGGTTYRALSTVPIKTNLTAIELEKQDRPFGPKDQSAQLIAVWQDSAGIKNFYRLKMIVNDTIRTGQYMLMDDKLVDGAVIRRPLSRDAYRKGDTVTVELLSTDGPYYEYFRQISSIRGSRFSSAAPYNPKGNFDNDALGYFGITYRSKKQVIIQ